ncbi:MAG TPA: CbiX/SirB N-terminal domain-containing protein [Usitatibacteraceae bacterium]|jgi:sirohydrochlorin cobaltochelatase|nr:CbiX/SirB N-terminal domain-containing protein [Usitatibacteraceae bacterium]
MQGIVLFAHGARDPQWAQPFEAIRARVQARRPEYPVVLAFLERMTPSLAEACDQLVARGVTAVTVFPVFMGQGGHLKEDLPRIVEEIRATHPGLPIALQPAAGEDPVIHEAMAGWVLSRFER